MKQIFKSPLVMLPSQTIRLPVHAKIRHVDKQEDGKYYLWVELDTNDTRIVNRRITMVGTGRPFDPCGEYIGTILDGGSVWHFYAGVAT